MPTDTPFTLPPLQTIRLWVDLDDRIFADFRQCVTSVEVLEVHGDCMLEAEAPEDTRLPWRTVRVCCDEHSLSHLLTQAQRMGAIGACEWQVSEDPWFKLTAEQVCAALYLS